MPLPARRPHAHAAVLAAAVTLAVVACGGDAGEGAAADPAGAELFRNNCAVCHGPGGEGAAGGPPLVHERYVPAETSDDDVAAAVQAGVDQQHWDLGDMPAMSGLSDVEVAAITQHVRELQRDAGLID